MVRQMKCPYCGTNVNVSSHWTNATCQNCHNNFEIGVDIFEISEEEQKKEMELATQKVHEQEKLREERSIETKRRLRQMLHIPEPDPHAKIKFEDEEEAKTETQENMDGNKKKMLIIGGIAGVVLLFIIVFVIMITSAMKGSSESAAATPAVQQQPNSAQTAELTQETNQTDVTSEAHDGAWTDGYAIDSNTSDGRYKIDLQSSDTGEQREVASKTVEEQPQTSANESVSGNTIQAEIQNTDNGNTSHRLSDNTSPATAVDNDSASTTPGQVGTSDKELLNTLFNGMQ